MRALAFFCGIQMGLCTIGGLCAEEYRTDHVIVSYTDIDRAYAEAIGRTVEASRQICAEDLGFSMPAVIRVRVTVAANKRPRLFNDGAGDFSLTVRSPRDLQKPATSGIYHLYGLCHETAHLAMYRPISDRRWMTTAAAEGWAHYLGSVLVDTVYRQQGPDLWPDRYEYLLDGTQRLAEQAKSSAPSTTVEGALLWKRLVDDIGMPQVAKLFERWGTVSIDPTDPGVALGKAINEIDSDASARKWWTDAESVFVFKREQSEFQTQTAKATELSGDPQELALDDGQSAGKRSSAGGGHAVRFEAAGDSWYLTSLKIFGSRYGTSTPPKDKFQVWLCDEQFNVIREISFPYRHFRHGEPRWVTLPISPVNVPRKFIVCVGFNPTARKGVFVHYDGGAASGSLSGLPGRAPRALTRGNWMIRATIDEHKDANPLGAGAKLESQPATGSVTLRQLTGRPKMLRHDDGRASGKRSIAGGAHAVAFETSGEAEDAPQYVTSVRIHGSRYGTAAAPREDFHVWICDEKSNVIEKFDFPYSRFQRGNPRWVNLRTKPTLVPKNFHIYVDFDPKQTKGVFVSHDKAGSGTSYSGLPGPEPRKFDTGDWLIRVQIDQLKEP